MPWETDENGNPKYKLTAYRHGELPTWRDLYTFYKDKIFIHHYDISNANTDTDPYLSVNKKLALLVQSCNQLNKIVNYDIDNYTLNDIVTKCILRYQFMIDILKSEKITFDDNFMYQYERMIKISTIRFYIFPEKNDVESLSFAEAALSNDLYIYTFEGLNHQYDNGSNAKRIFVDDNLKCNISIALIIKFEGVAYGTSALTIQCCPDWYELYTNQNTDKWKFIYDIITELLSPVIRYFEGSGIGWKDDSGNLMEQKSNKASSCNGVGVDPAL